MKLIEQKSNSNKSLIKAPRKIRSRNLSEAEIKKALETCGGWQSRAAELLNVSPSTISKRIAKSEELRSFLDSVKMKHLDEAEDQLQQLIKQGNPAAIFFYLKTQGQHRGYIEKQHILNEVTDININVLYNNESVEQKNSPVVVQPQPKRKLNPPKSNRKLKRRKIRHKSDQTQSKLDPETDQKDEFDQMRDKLGMPNRPEPPKPLDWSDGQW